MRAVLSFSFLFFLFSASSFSLLSSSPSSSPAVCCNGQRRASTGELPSGVGSAGLQWPEKILRAADVSRFETVSFPLPGLFPLRPGIFSACGIFLASELFFPLPQGFFPLRQNVFWHRKGFFPLRKRFLSAPKGIVLRFRYFSRFPKIFFPLR